MDKILYLDHVDQYNRLYGLETLHPLVSVINLNEATRAWAPYVLITECMPCF